MKRKKTFLGTCWWKFFGLISPGSWGYTWISGPIASDWNWKMGFQVFHRSGMAAEVENRQMNFDMILSYQKGRVSLSRAWLPWYLCLFSLSRCWGLQGEPILEKFRCWVVQPRACQVKIEAFCSMQVLDNRFISWEKKPQSYHILLLPSLSCPALLSGHEGFSWGFFCLQLLIWAFSLVLSGWPEVKTGSE